MGEATKPRRARGDGGVYQRSDGMWAGALQLPPGLDGKRRRKVVYGRTEDEVLEKLGKAKRALTDSGDLATGTPTVADWMQQYLDRREAEGRYSAATLRGYREKSRNYIVPALGRMKLDQLRPPHIYRVHDLARSGGRSETTARQAHMVLSSALAAAYRMGLIQSNPCEAIDAPDRDYYEGNPLEAADAIRVLDWSDGRAWHDLRNSIALLTGPRAGEALGLTRGAVHLDTNTLDYVRQLQRVPPGKEPPKTRARYQVTGNYWLVELKRGSRRYGVPLLPRVRDVLEVRLAEMDAAGLTDPMDLIFTGARGGPMSPERDWARWKEALRSAGVQEIRRHDARHTTATLLYAAGVDPLTIQSILGHTTAKMTAHYTQIRPAQRQQAMTALGGLLALPSGD